MTNFADLKISSLSINDLINKEGSFDSDIPFEYKLNDNFCMTAKGFSLSKTKDSADFRIKLYSSNVGRLLEVNSMSFLINKKYAHHSLAEIVHGFGKMDFYFTVGLHSLMLTGTSVTGSESLIRDRVRVEDLAWKKTPKGVHLGSNLFYNHALQNLYYDVDTYKNIGVKEYFDKVDFTQIDISADNHLIIGKYTKRREINNLANKFSVTYYNFPSPVDIDIPVYLFCSEGEFALKIPNLLEFCNDYMNSNAVQAALFLRSQLDFSREKLVTMIGTENKSKNIKDFLSVMLDFTKEQVKVHQANEELMD